MTTLRQWSMALGTGCIASAAMTVNAGAEVCGSAARFDNRIILRAIGSDGLAQFTSAFEAAHAAQQVDLALLDSIPSRHLHLLSLSAAPGTDLHALEQDLQGNTAYDRWRRWGEFLYESTVPETTTGSTWVDHVTDDAAFLSQYAAGMIGLPQAHQRSRGGGTAVAVLDTGLDAAHPLFAGRILAGGYNFIDGNTNTADVGDGVDNDADLEIDEMVGHGTFIAGLVMLVAPDARLLPVKVASSDGLSDGWVLAKGMFHAIDRGVEVINISLSSQYKHQGVEDATDEATSLGIIVVAAAGNCNYSTREYPACNSGALGVAAVDAFDVKAAFSNYEEQLVLSAPGDSAPGDLDHVIVSALPGAQFAVSEGTSMAAPLVAGAAALIRAQHPEWPASEATFDQLEQRLAETSVNIDAQNPEYIGQLGAGRLDIAAAVAAGPVAPRLGDLNNDGQIGITDLLVMLAEWGRVHSSADLDSSGSVNVMDLLLLLSDWG